MLRTATHTRISAAARPGGASLSALWLRLFAPVDIAPLVYFRITLAGILLWEIWRYWANGWIERYWITPAFHFTYYGFSWVQPWPGNWLYAHFGLLALATLCLGVGFYTRYSAVGVWLGFTYIFLLDQTNYLNHLYLICWITGLLVFLPSGHALALDVFLGETPASRTAPAWTLWLLRFQIGVAYFFGGVAKINGDWLRGEPIRSWLAAQTDFPLLGPYFTQEWLVYLFAYGGLFFDLGVVFALLWPPTRLLACLFVLFFHLTNSQLFSIGIFPWFMLAVTPLFFPADWLRQAGHWLGLTSSPSAPLPTSMVKATTSVRYLSTAQRVTVALLGLYVIFQLAMPFRHLLYPGNVHWTEEGHNFSWHMKLRDKSGQTNFLVRDPASGQRWLIHNQEYLSSRQISKMSTRPDMILQFAHYLAQGYRAKGYPQAEVYARAIVSLNGRPAQLLIDPAVNLAAQPRNLWPAPWILPLRTALPQPHPSGTDDAE
jgi:vitamin K-dependent gamma-carboxylase